MCQEALNLERSNGGKRTEDTGKSKIMICGTGLDLLQSSGEFHVPTVTLEWAATASSAMAGSTGCTRNAVGSST